MQCCQCQQDAAGKMSKAGGELRPRNWQEQPEGTFWCERCWKDHWCLRSIELPVVGPHRPEDGTWEELRKDLRLCWQNATTWANWARHELVKADVVRLPGMEKLPPRTKLYLYGLWNVQRGRTKGKARGKPAPDDPESLNANSRNAVFRAVERKYHRDRYASLWLRQRRSPEFTYPYPFPVHDDEWTATFGKSHGRDADPDEAKGHRTPLVTLTLAGKRRTLRLRGGDHHRYQLAVFAQIVAGKAKQCQLSLYEKKVQESDHRSGIPGRRPGGGRSSISRVMVKIAAWVRKRTVETTAAVLHVNTTNEEFLIYYVDAEPKKSYHADHLKRWEAERKRREAQRRGLEGPPSAGGGPVDPARVAGWTAARRTRLDHMADDLKYERRCHRRVRRTVVDSLGPWLEKHRRRLDSFTHEASAMIAAYAARRRVAQVILDTRERRYFRHDGRDEFPWHALVTKLQYKLEERGIAFEHIKAEEETDGEPAGTDEPRTPGGGRGRSRGDQPVRVAPSARKRSGGEQATAKPARKRGA